MHTSETERVAGREGVRLFLLSSHTVEEIGSHSGASWYREHIVVTTCRGGGMIANARAHNTFEPRVEVSRLSILSANAVAPAGPEDLAAILIGTPAW